MYSNQSNQNISMQTTRSIATKLQNDYRYTVKKEKKNTDKIHLSLAIAINSLENVYKSIAAKSLSRNAIRHEVVKRWQVKFLEQQSDAVASFVIKKHFYTLVIA